MVHGARTQLDEFEFVLTKITQWQITSDDLSLKPLNVHVLIH